MLTAPALFALSFAIPDTILPPHASRAAAAIAWMAVWWVTEVVPLPVTALLPLVLFPVAGILPAGDVAVAYANRFVFLMGGGFVLAEAMQQHGLHRRIALGIVARVGGGPRRLVLGFMIAAAFLSMWLSNTATAAMLYPIALAVSGRVAAPAFAPALMLGTAYACNIGGIGTLVGTFPNVVFAGMVPDLLPGSSPPDFLGWMLIGVPLVIVLIPMAWLVLTTWAYPQAGGPAGGGTAEIRDEIRRLPPISTAERRTAWVFAATALLWITRRGLHAGQLVLPGWTELVGLDGLVDDSTVAIAAALALFLIPAGRSAGTSRRRLLDARAFPAIPWPILLLFGGGFALAAGFTASGLGNVVAGALGGMPSVPLPLLLFIVALLISFLTEVNSNTATTTTFLPLVAAVAPALGAPVFPLLLAVTLSASCAFMLPTATPPNAIVFASGRLEMRSMARTGLVLNVLAAGVVATACWLVFRVHG